MLTGHVNIVGAGLAGPLLALLLAQRGLAVTMFDRRADPRRVHTAQGRSINLALAARGLRALSTAGALEAVQPIMIAMRARAVHEGTLPPSLFPYGQRPHEVIYSVSRDALNRTLIDLAARDSRIQIRFSMCCQSIDVPQQQLDFVDEAAGGTESLPLDRVIATDGAGSAIRRSLAGAGLLTTYEDLLDHDYKELEIPRGSGLDRDALHIWPRGGFMLIALPNTDGSFTATLFLPKRGSASSFEALRTGQAVGDFFAREFASAAPLIPDLESQFLVNPQGLLGTIHCAPWHVTGEVLLLGDAAHAIVPFHGQGMNCAFEDCVELAELVDQSADWSTAFAEFERRRRPQAAAIAQMALENYDEMRDSVRDPRFQRLKTLGLALERRHPRRFIPRYSMVMFHAGIPYTEALRRGSVQAQILDRLDQFCGDAGERSGGIDGLSRADSWIESALSELELQ